MGYGPRPTGVTILAVLAALLAVVFLIALFGSVLLLVLSNNTDLLNQLTSRGAPQWIVDNFRTIFAVLATAAWRSTPLASASHLSQRQACVRPSRHSLRPPTT